jgi:hypothetical protein
MQVKDEAAWTQQLLELEADEHTRQFKSFLVFWMETTEKLFDETDAAALNRRMPKTCSDSPHFVAMQISKALTVAEQTFGYLSIEWIAQMLLVMTQYWAFGENLYDGLSRIEQRLVDQATAMKLLDLQETARSGDRVTTEQ